MSVDEDKMTDNIMEKYGARCKRMVDRWAGIRGQRQTTEMRNRTEIISTRPDANVDDTDNTQVDNAESFVIERPRSVPVLARCEVLVVGGGPSGLSAALSAKRAGCDVMLMDRYGCFGGVITTVGMETISWYRYEGCMNDSQGIGIEMERLADRMGGSLKWPYNESTCLDADFFKVVADHLICETGVRPLLHCWAVEEKIRDKG